MRGGAPGRLQTTTQRVIQGGQVARKRLVDRLCADAFDRLPANVRVLDLRPFHGVAAGDESVHGVLAVLPRRVQQIGRQRLVGLFRHVLGRARPEIIPGERRDVAKRLSVPLSLVNGRLGDGRPCGAAAATLPGISSFPDRGRAGFGTWPHGLLRSGCRDIIGPVPPSLLIRLK